MRILGSWYQKFPIRASGFLQQHPSLSSRRRRIRDADDLNKSQHCVVLRYISSVTSQGHTSIDSTDDNSCRRGLVVSYLQSKVDSGMFRTDPAQMQVAKRLDRLHQALVGYDNRPIVDAYFQKLKRQENIDQDSDDGTQQLPSSENCLQPKIRIPRGLYIHGSVGSGKSMLMDAFYRNEVSAKQQRVHFHEFMANVHERVHQQKKFSLQKYGRSFHVDTDISRNPIHHVGLQLATEVSLLCLDEFQVTDVCDAVILSQLFNVLFSMGTVVVATSNRHPSKLYEGGLNREYFLPFIDLLQKHCIVHEIKSNRDYRDLMSSKIINTFLVHTNEEISNSQLSVIVKNLRKNLPVFNTDLDAGFGRKISVESDAEAIVGYFHFEDLCDRNLGASDYRAIAKHFAVVVIQGIPRLNLDEHNRARRFITLIDELYENHTCLVCSSIASPDELFENSFIDIDTGEKAVGLGIDEAVSHGHAIPALASVRELSFAFRRAASRLKEMTSKSWWDTQDGLWEALTNKEWNGKFIL